MNNRKHFLRAIKEVQEPDIATCAMIIAGEFQPGLDIQGEHFIDPFKGCLVTKEECYSIIANLYGRHHEPDDRYFERADSRQLLRRILENLKAINLQKGNASHAMVCLDYQLMLYPDAVELLQQQDELLRVCETRGNLEKASCTSADGESCSGRATTRVTKPGYSQHNGTHRYISIFQSE